MVAAHIPFRKNIPARSDVAQRQNYRTYKSQLRLDFHTRCGYCDDRDRYYGGVRGAHIDHFAPKSKFDHLKSSYENLVYSCPYCNSAKYDKWIGNDANVPNDGASGFVDPCGPELDRHLGRSREGSIIALTPLGRYLVENLNLRLVRHQITWQMDRIERLREELRQLRSLVPVNTDKHNELTDAIENLFDEYLTYMDALYET